MYTKSFLRRVLCADCIVYVMKSLGEWDAGRGLGPSALRGRPRWGIRCGLLPCGEKIP